MRDTREDYVWHQDLGPGTLELLDAASGPVPVVDFAARRMPADCAGWMPGLLRAWLKERPEAGQATAEAIFDHLAAAIDSPAELAAIRRLTVLQLAEVVVRAARGRRPLRYPSPEPDVVREACAVLSPDHPARLVYRGRNRDLVRGLARTRCIPAPACGKDAPLVLDDVAPLIAAAVPELLAGEERGYSRGQRLRIGLETLEAIRDRGGRWDQGEPPLGLPAGAWGRLDRTLDPMGHLEPRVRELLRLMERTPSDRRDIILEAAEFLPALERRGGRIGASALARLQDTLDAMRRSAADADRVAAPRLAAVLHDFRRGAGADCRSRSGQCAE